MLDTEKILLENHQLPSVFFRFPGLVSNKERILELRQFGLLFPNTDKKRRPSKQLVQYADFVKHIRSNVLKNSQLPNNILHTNIRKPKQWEAKDVQSKYKTKNPLAVEA